MSRVSSEAAPSSPALAPPDGPILSWARSDVEQRLGFRGGRFTRTNNLVSFLGGGLLTAAFYGALLPFRGSILANMFLERGPTQYGIALLTCWSAVILLLKTFKLRLQRAALAWRVIPEGQDFILSAATVDDCLGAIHAAVDDPKHFTLFNRIVIALSNLRNLGRISDVDDILNSQAEHDESLLETSYSIVQGFVWAIPVLGFIGTVLGLSEAIGGFGAVLGGANDVSQIKSALGSVTAGLYTAFDTTLAGLVAAMAIQLWLVFLKKSEEEFLDDCGDYCLRNVVSRLRIMPFERERE